VETVAKIVVQHDLDPAIAIVLEYEAPGGRHAQGWYGECTECGWPMHRWGQPFAIDAAKAHVDRHDGSVVGIDPSSVVH